MRCIARAYGDEPLEREAVAARRDLIYVVNPSVYDATKDVEDSGVGFPVEFVFAFDAGLFERLRSAFNDGDRAQLWALWETAKPFKAELQVA